jgi:predicted nucleotidyltransferase
MERLAERLASIPGVVAVTLGGSRALGASRPDSDWDFGLYCRVGLMDAQSLSLEGLVPSCSFATSAKRSISPNGRMS